MNKLFQVMGALVLLLGLVAGCGGAETPAVFMLSDLDVPAATVNSTVAIGVTVTNDGEAAGDCDVNLTIGNHTDSKPVTLEGGASTLVSFSYDTTVEGSYPVGVATPDDTEAGTLTVTAEAANGEPVNGDEGVIPSVGVGSKWVYQITYEDPVGTPKYDPVLFNTELLELGVMLEQEVLDDGGSVVDSITTETYKAHIGIVPNSTRDVILPIEVQATISELDIWVSAGTGDFLRQLAYTHGDDPMPFKTKTYIDYFYSGAHGWPYTVGTSWDYTLQQMTREAVIPLLPSFADRSVEVAGMEDVTVTLYDLSQINLDTGEITGTGTETTFSCQHVKHFEDGALAYEEWVALVEIGTAVKMVDHAQYVGTETRLLVYYDVK